MKTCEEIKFRTPHAIDPTSSRTTHLLVDFHTDEDHPVVAERAVAHEARRARPRGPRQVDGLQGPALVDLRHEVAQRVGDARRAGLVEDGVRRHQGLVAPDGVARQPREQVHGRREAVGQRVLHGPVLGQRVLKERQNGLDVHVEELVADADRHERKHGGVDVRNQVEALDHGQPVRGGLAPRGLHLALVGGVVVVDASIRGQRRRRPVAARVFHGREHGGPPSRRWSRALAGRWGEAVRGQYCAGDEYCCEFPLLQQQHHADPRQQ